MTGIPADPDKEDQTEQHIAPETTSDTALEAVRLGELLENLKTTREEAQKAALKALEEASKKENTTVNNLEPGRIDFQTAARKLEEVGIFLGHEIEKAYTRDERLDLLRLPQEESGEHLPAEDLTEPGKYRQHFQDVTFDAKDIDKVIEMVKAGEKVMTNCARGGFTPASAFKALFVENGIPYYADALEYLDNLRRIEAKDIDDLEYLDRKIPLERLAAFEAAYQKAKPLEPSVSSITFSLNELEVSNVGTSAIQDLLLSVKENIKYLSPIEHFIMIINQINEGLAEIVGEDVFQKLSVEDYQELLKKVFEDKTIYKYMPDKKKVTRFSNYVREDGFVPYFDFDTDFSEMCVYYYNPDRAHDIQGSRISLG